MTNLLVIDIASKYYCNQKDAQYTIARNCELIMYKTFFFLLKKPVT